MTENIRSVTVAQALTESVSVSQTECQCDCETVTCIFTDFTYLVYDYEALISTGFPSVCLY